jgi:hypothetical protein
MRPSVFIGSSKESRHLAYALQENLEDDAEVTVWTQSVFDLSRSTLTSLLASIGDWDFAVFILADDDITKIRSEEVTTPRDNVILEMGIALGRLGAERTFFVAPRDQENFHIPTDLAGITPARYDSKRSDGNWRAALGPTANRIRAAIEQAIPKPFDEHLLKRLNALQQPIRSLFIHSITHSRFASQFPAAPELGQLPTTELAAMELAAWSGHPNYESLGTLHSRFDDIHRNLHQWIGEEWQSASINREIQALERDVAKAEGRLHPPPIR